MTPTNSGKGKKTAESLDTFIRMTILGLKCNPNYSKLGEELEKMYIERYGKK